MKNIYTKISIRGVNEEINSISFNAKSFFYVDKNLPESFDEHLL